MKINEISLIFFVYKVVVKYLQKNINIMLVNV